MKSFKKISCILIQLEKDNILRTKGIVPTLTMSRFPRFFTHRAMLLARNDGIRRWYAIPEYSTGVFAALTAGRGDDFSGLSIYGTSDPNFVFATKDKGPQLLPLQHRNFFAITGRSFACSFNQALNVRCETPNIRSIPRISPVARSLGASTP